MSSPASSSQFIKRKVYLPDTYYHIYSRGVNKDKIFLNESDKAVFISLLKRYLSPKPSTDNIRRLHKSYFGQVQLLTYALMPNHFHLLIHQQDREDMVHFMKSLMTSYSMYFNRRYKRVGPVFQSRYLAKKINGDDQLAIVSRYIHLNPSNWQNSTDSSIDFYSNTRNADWLTPSPVLDKFANFEAYLNFLKTFNPDEAEAALDLDPDS
jgi:putative transposase